MKSYKKVLCLFLSLLFFVQLLAADFTAFAADGAVFVNGQPFSGTVAEAISAAGQNGIVEIEGTVYTEPIGKRDGSLVSDITICGRGNNAELILAEDFIPREDDNLDVLTIKGCNVTVRDLTINARYFVDYPICIFCGTDGINIENVTVLHGIRGGFDIMTGGVVQFKDVRANETLQGGFVFENTGDAANISFENCTTEGNLYNVGVIIKNGYGPCTNVDASGITCYEGCFAFHDRVAGTVGGGERKELTLAAPPLNGDGEPISLDYGVYFPVEKAYQHIRFGSPESETYTAEAKITTSKYGFDTVIYYDDMETAQASVRGGDVLEEQKSSYATPAWIIRIILLITRLSKLFS